MDSVIFTCVYVLNQDLIPDITPAVNNFSGKKFPSFYIFFVKSSDFVEDELKD